ncbi:MAG: DEAD/DEAH box helicase family protein, partial [Paludibacteraceae bacterium]|nr:DEAD/DEAH box helicase family protein [Paludibacteraceae bacterium]
MRNFDYLRDLGFDSLHRYCSAAEENQVCNPDTSAINSRRALEYVVRALYKMKHIEVDERVSLFELVDSIVFRQFIGDDRVMMAVHYVRKVGNNAAHVGSVTKKESFFALLNIYNVVGAVLMKLRVVDEVKPFNRTLIPNSVQQAVVVPAKVEVKGSDAIVAVVEPEALTDNAPVKEMASELSEAETRALYIDLMLKEAGWDVLAEKGAVQPLKACVEVEVKGMPNAHDVGYVDYVLFGGNGKPLAVVEAKRTTVSPINGKHQAELYADCIEAQYGVRPVIYYTNGFETYVIDGLGYPPRRLYGFHTANDLELMIQQRGRKDISDFTVKDNITDRAYQKMAIKAVCEHLNKKHRRALLVMATGTGKTRVAISMVDVLMRNGWVKNVLFLADRVSLVNQAHKNFVKLMPNATTSVLSDSDKRDMTARITFSTYQTMINYIDTDKKPFSVGRFDLIIIDEAHRSIFGKYGAVFNYFDAMLVGLTATPRDEVEKSTYDIFEMEQGEPNYAYELGEAVAEGYLVDCRVLKRGSVVLKEGIKYDTLTKDEKEQMEQIWEYEQANQVLKGVPQAAEDSEVYGRPYVRDIDGKEIFNYIYNRWTVDAVLQDLMENGLKVQYGERIGKTIIFAYNHNHAEMIVERFGVLYPEYGSDFCVLIDNRVTYAQDLINKFEVRDNNPQIAVSVDMLDTGIDVPDVLNLVFFKPVKSRIKFMQMIGRGTRLSANVFAEGQDKEFFYIFDWCCNFDFFDKKPEGHVVKNAMSLTECLFGLRAEIAYHLQHQSHQEIELHKAMHDELKQGLKEQVMALSDSHISVRAKWESVSRFKSEAAWLSLSLVDVQTLKNDIAPLLPKNTLDASAKMFDALVLAIELAFVSEEHKAGKKIAKVQTIAEYLCENKA